MSDKTYEDGLQEGRLAGLEAMVNEHKGRMDNHSQRLRLLERIVWGLAGIAFLIEFYPKAIMFLGGS